ncbi:FAD-binding oxidoreductase [Acetobacter tropicalis]|uniref:D-amino acid dehydrogenase small subunit n=1 Tax=Acetobacter tropicalis TaxID=104102 RepID=A0A094YYB2_9PROT|nr:FAD-binding oxidoreductase [Acetobacter tropicalis]KAA8384242.1 FAD-binding oxidoreductase [Acetobacter tropicalis]KAA8391345.1 FAD-binding oxidoreductase [Acetobacter tropicalis]KGB26367.1 D-amino acid dehydrogenase small subunit [Acetobacter tropicalis]MBC9009246.1 FAD-binding oxidoreductase [Acetobacter tropicalis]MDO8172406.1 FAD-binding oxidoreductase [Acetobacter tropicalis]
MHICVIGTGIIGTCTGAYLQRDGHRVTFVDPYEPGDACSFGNAGSLSPSACLPVGMPGMWRKVPHWLMDPSGPLTVRWPYLPHVAPWLVRLLYHSSRKEVERIATALRALLTPIFESYAPLLEWAHAQELVRHDGCLYVYSSREIASQWQWGMDLRRRLGVEMRDVNRDELESLEPDLKGRFRFGILAPQNGATTDPSKLVKTLNAKCIANGATHIRQRVTGFKKKDGLLQNVMLDNGETLPVDGVVVAGGAWSGNLAHILGVTVPLETQRGYHVTINSSNLTLSHTIMAVEHNMMVNPMAMGLRLAGTVELAGLKPPPNYSRADALLARGIEMFPHLDTSRLTKWMGHRPCLPDSLPVIGRAPTVENAWLAFGHGHIGMCAGAPTGREIAGLVAGRAPSIDLTPFSPSRWSGPQSFQRLYRR